jgi:hypothetical protein
MSNDDNNNNTSPFKTSWAGQDAKIHAPKTAWSTGNYTIPEAPKDKPKPTVDNAPKDNTKDASYKWLLCKHIYTIIDICKK